MKIVIPIDENKETVCVAFARAPYFLVCDTESEKKEFLPNPAASAQSGAGIKAAQYVADLAPDALITVRLGENSAQVLKQAEIKIYKSGPVGAKANLEALKKNELSELSEFHAGFHGKI